MRDEIIDFEKQVQLKVTQAQTRYLACLDHLKNVLDLKLGRLGSSIEWLRF